MLDDGFLYNFRSLPDTFGAGWFCLHSPIYPERAVVRIFAPLQWLF
jgi:hypothetical protein